MADAQIAPSSGRLTHRPNRRQFLKAAAALGGIGGAALAATPVLLKADGKAAPPLHPLPATAPLAVDFSDPRLRMQHLLRRVGFAPTRDEVERGLDAGEAAVLDAALRPAGPATLSDRLVIREGDSYPDAGSQVIEWWLRRMLRTNRPTEEKLTLFWHGWHVTGFDKLDYGQEHLLHQQLQFQREQATAKLGGILKGLSRQPAILLYLDSAENVAGHPNENFARELMELFAMGAGAFSETDVREAARAFTGYTLDDDGQKFRFDERTHDYGEKTVIGVRGELGGDDVIDAALRSDATPWYVARKAWTRFAYADPDDETLQPVADAFVRTGGEMGAVFRAVFEHPAFYSDRAYRALVKSPIEYLVGASRQLGVMPGSGEARRWCERMGQLPGWPPNVGGWPGGRAWLGSGPFLSRCNAADALLFEGMDTDWDTGAFLKRNGIETARELADWLLVTLIDGAAASEARDALIEYASGGRGGGTPLRSMEDDERKLRVRGAAYCVLTSPDYQLA